MTKRLIFVFQFFLFSILFIPSSLIADCKFEQVIKGDELAIGIMLEWSTCIEESNSMFIIEKSEDGISFKNIGAVKGAGNAKSVTEYSFLDVNAKAERLYYRLRQIDFDGSFSFSQVYTLNKKTPNQFAVAYMSSIMAAEEFVVSVNAFESGQLEYAITDINGKVLNTAKTKMTKGQNKITIDLSTYKENIYRLKLKMAGEEELLTFKKISAKENEKLHFAITKDCKK